MSRNMKLVGGAVVAIVLGAIGSGLWERLLEPAYEGLSSAIVSGIGAVFSSFRDSIYSEAARGFHEKYSLVLYGLVLGALSGLYLGFWLAIYVGGKASFREVSAGVFRLVRRHQMIGVMALAALVTFFVLDLQARAANRVTTWSLTSIEILSPQMEPEGRTRLRAKFFSVETASDFESFHEELLLLANEYNVQLRELDVP